MADTPPPSTDSGWANPAVIGLTGFGLTTMVTGLASTGNLLVGLGPTLALALVFGGVAQLFAGIVALRKGELFAGSAFIGYGSFWMSAFSMLEVLPTWGYHLAPHDVLAFYVVWTLFTFSFLLNAPKHGIGITAIFGLLFVAFVLLSVNEAMAAYGSASSNFAIAMGWEVFATGLVAWLVATATLTNANYGRKIIPL